MENNKLWGEILEVVKSEISPKAFNTWFKTTSFEIKENNSFIIYVANEFASDWIRKNYFTLIHAAAEKVLEKEVKVIITSKNNLEASDTMVSLI